ncbi:hypothetical protein T07_12072 [Trichinella nelsoni]|uniref:Integrase zinc-binding domain-containing protein n=1 Tax=Trichinella nelsoni TaxID=6336 RepID=A0A0V0S241_9BILA|nr:hypothetical protein T07_12072 [Trichinella nelsoni]
MATRMVCNKVLPLRPLTTTPLRSPPPFTGNGDLKIWLMRLVDYFEENAIPEERRYGFTKLLLSDEGYGIAAGFGRQVIRNQFITDIRQEAVFEQLVRRELANFEAHAHVEAQEAEQTEAALCVMRLDRHPPATSPGQCGCCRHCPCSRKTGTVGRANYPAHGRTEAQRADLIEAADPAHASAEMTEDQSLNYKPLPRWAPTSDTVENRPELMQIDSCSAVAFLRLNAYDSIDKPSSRRVVSNVSQRCLLDADFISGHGCVFNFALGTLTCGFNQMLDAAESMLEGARIDPLDRKGQLAGKATNIGQSDPAHALVPEGTTTPSVPQPEAQVEGPTKEQVVRSQWILDVLQRMHESPEAGHLGVEKTLERLKGRFY